MKRIRIFICIALVSIHIMSFAQVGMNARGMVTSSSVLYKSNIDTNKSMIANTAAIAEGLGFTLWGRHLYHYLGIDFYNKSDLKIRYESYNKDSTYHTGNIAIFRKRNFNFNYQVGYKLFTDHKIKIIPLAGLCYFPFVIDRKSTNAFTDELSSEMKRYKFYYQYGMQFDFTFNNVENKFQSLLICISAPMINDNTSRYFMNNTMVSIGWLLRVQFTTYKNFPFINAPIEED
jgi:hypothetical protein